MIQTLFGSVEQEPSLLERLKSGVEKTRAGLVSALEDALQGKKEIDADLLDELESTLIAADIGVRTTDEILERIRQSVERHQLGDAAGLKGLIREQLLEILQASERAPARVAEPQLEIWGQRAGAEVIRQRGGSDPSAVLFDAVQAARARKVDYVIVDTAGRLQNKEHLMAELQKMSRTAAKVIPGAPHEVLLVLDATTGQNGLEQARKFTETSGVTGIVLAKLDGTAKGGIVVAIARELNLPIRYVGVGEKVEDLLPFDPEKFIESLFET
jgi:fused signal recognition particle receptor